MKREYVRARLHSVRGIVMHQLVWVHVEPGGSSPLEANNSTCLECEMPIPPGTREELFIRATAKSLEEWALMYYKLIQYSDFCTFQLNRCRIEFATCKQCKLHDLKKLSQEKPSQ